MCIGCNFLVEKGGKVVAMDTYKERENALFARWKAACVAQEGDDALDNFVSDGLLFRGAIEQVCGCWEQRSGHETELWDNSPNFKPISSVHHLFFPLCPSTV